MNISNVYFSALVVNNNDPDKKGRIKVRVSPQHDSVSNENLPWSLPVIFSDMLNIPEQGTYVWVIFQQGNEYEPIYFGYVLQTNSFNSGIYAEDYPNTIGILTDDAWISLNRKTKKIELKNPTNTIKLDTGGITINSNSACSITVTGNCNIQSSAQVNVTAPIINLN